MSRRDLIAERALTPYQKNVIKKLARPKEKTPERWTQGSKLQMMCGHVVSFQLSGSIKKDDILFCRMCNNYSVAKRRVDESQI